MSPARGEICDAFRQLAARFSKEQGNWTREGRAGQNTFAVLLYFRAAGPDRSAGAIMEKGVNGRAGAASAEAISINKFSLSLFSPPRPRVTRIWFESTWPWSVFRSIDRCDTPVFSSGAPHAGPTECYLLSTSPCCATVLAVYFSIGNRLSLF